METAIRERLSCFAGAPSLETFEALRRELIKSPAYAPYSGDLRKLENLFQQKRHQEVIQAFQRSLPNLLLSPRAHLLAGIAHKELGQEQESKAEIMLMQLCLHGIQMTGDGTHERPFKVTSVSDEYDVLEAMQKKLQMQALSSAGGKPCDVLTLEDGTVLVFDISDCMAKLSDSMQPRNG